MRFLLAFIFLFSQTTFGQTAGKTAEFNSVTGADYFTNFVKSPSAKKNASNTTTSSATVSRDTSAGNLIDGVSSYSIDTSANGGYVEFTLDTITSPADGGNCEYKGVFKGDATLYAAQILDGSGNVLNQISPLTNETAWRPFSVSYPCGTSRKVRVAQTIAGTSPAINVGKLYYGQATNIGVGVPNNVFSAKVSAQCTTSPCTIDSQGPSTWLTNITRSGTGSYSLNFPAGQFNLAPVCTFYFKNSASRLSFALGSISTSTTSYVFTIADTAGVSVDAAFDIICTRAGTDFIQPAITPNQWNYDWTAANISTTQAGFGTVSFSNAMDCRNKRSGSDLIYDCKFTTGTASATTASITLPSGLVVDSTKVPSIRQAEGYWIRGIAAANNFKQGSVLITGGTSVVNFSTDAYPGTNNPFTALGGTGFVGNGETFQFYARIPIQGWTENQNAPQLLGSVTQDGPSSDKSIRTRLTCGNSGSAILKQNSGISSIANGASAGLCTVTVSGYSDEPQCSCNVIGVSSSSVGCMFTSLSSTTIGISRARGGALENGDITLNCQGPR